jgi:glycosyltransferase involved in cell wall biosynthesis
MPEPVPATRPRLTMAITELDIGGAEKAFVTIAKGLAGRGWNVRVISLRDAGPLAETLRAAGIPVTALNAGGFPDARAVWRMKAALQKDPCDVLLTFLHQANIAGRLAARWAGIRSVVCGVRVADRRWSVILPERLTSHLVDQYIAVSKAVGDVPQRLCHLSPDRIIAIPNGVDADAIEQRAAVDRRLIGCQATDKIVLCVGRLSQQKAPLDVLRAFARMKQQPSANSSRAKLVFVGDGPMLPVLKRSIAGHGLQDQVQLLGWSADVWAIMKSSDLLVLASHWEGLPNVILEAQAAGLPVVASDVDGCRELITDGVTGRLFRAGDVDHLATVLAESFEVPQVLQSYTVAALSGIKQHYCWETCIGRFHDLLRNHVQ